MSNDPVDGGTVTYHRADYHPATDEPWLVWFTKDQADPYWFTAEQGEAMGLTPPEPAPLVVTCNGHRIELSDEEADALVDTYGDRDTVTGKLARLLRDARQDPQPTTETHADQPTADELQAALNVQFDAPVPVPAHWQPIQQAAYRDGWLDAMQRAKDSTDTAAAARLLGGGE